MSKFYYIAIFRSELLFERGGTTGGHIFDSHQCIIKGLILFKKNKTTRPGTQRCNNVNLVLRL